MNHLEQLVAEWYEYQGYFLRQNVKVGKRDSGGYAGELDVVAFNAETDHLVHIEASLDSDTWELRERRFGDKFERGSIYIPDLFTGIETPDEIEQIALLAYASKINHQTIGGGDIVLVSELIRDILFELRSQPLHRSAVPENLPLMRTLQLVATYDDEALTALNS